MKGSFEMKRITAVLLCLVLAVCCAFGSVPADAADAKPSTGYTQKTQLKNADDFSWDNASVYFLLTDRFCNGNTSNDHSYGRATDLSGKALSGWESNPGTFHGGDFAGITKQINAGYFDNLGVDAIWLSAPYEQIHGYVTPGEPLDFSHYSYHGYYVLDYTEPDLNFGTRQEFQTMVDAAHKHGIRVVMDIVMNHAGYNTIKDMVTYNFGAYKDKNAAQSYIYKLTGVNSLHSTIDYESGASDWGRWWGADWVRSGLPGYTEEGGSDLTNSLAGLPDFKTEQSKSVSIPPILKTKWEKEGTYSKKVSKYGSSDSVSNYISKWLAEWVETYGVDGFRCDTAKHVEKASWKKLKTTCSAALKKWRQNNPSKDGAKWTDDFWMTGECWDYKSLDKTDYFTDGGFDSMINFGFSGSGVPAVSSINGVYQGYAGALNGEGKDGFNVLTYISSHDSNLARGDLIYQGSAFQLMPGAIQIFYGDETNRPTVAGMAFDGHGGSGHSLRSDMNWSSIDQNILKHWQKVGTFRRKHIAVGAGDHQQISAYSASEGYTFSRSYDRGDLSDSIIAVIGAPKNTKIPVNVSSIWGNKTKVTNFYDGSTAVVTDGVAEFDSGENGTILIEGPQSSIRVKLVGDYSFYDSETVTVKLKGADSATVKIEGGKEFKVSDGSTFKIGEGIEVGKVFSVDVTAKSGGEILETSFKFKKKDPAAVTRIYFDNSEYNWGDVNAYIYDESGGDVKANAAWPGKSMTYDSGLKLYTIDVDDGLEQGYVIFSGAGGRYPGEGAQGLPINETNMIFMGGNKWEAYTGQTPTSPPPPDPNSMTTVYFDNSSSNFSAPYIYYWNASTDKGETAWPGKAMQKYKDNVWRLTISKEYDSCIFSDKGGNQTGNLSIPSTNQIYNGSSWSSYADAEIFTTAAPTEAQRVDSGSDTPVITVPEGSVLLGDTNGDGAINIRDVTRIQKHLALLLTMSAEQQLAADCDGNRSISIKDATCIQEYIVKSLSRAGKCGTVKTISGTPAVTQATAAPVNTAAPVKTELATDAPTEAVKQYVYFKNSNWGVVKAYFWSEENKTMMSWPGNDMEKVSDDVHRAAIPDGATMVIFTNGGDQTKDLTIPAANMIFDGADWTAYGN